MADGKADELALDLFERPHLAGSVKERNIPFASAR
jgi:hypothetical protein